MNLTRRQLLKNSLLVTAAAPLPFATAWAGASAGPAHGELILYGTDRSTTELGLGLRQQGWAPRYEGRLDPLSLGTLSNGVLAAGFTDEAGIVLLTSLLTGRGRILALGRHTANTHQLASYHGPIVTPTEVEAGSWQAALGREYARLAMTSSAGQHYNRFQRPTNSAKNASELSFLVRL